MTKDRRGNWNTREKEQGFMPAADRSGKKVEIANDIFILVTTNLDYFSLKFLRWCKSTILYAFKHGRNFK